MDWENKSNNDIIVELKTMEQEYEVIKNRIAVEFGRLDELDRQAASASKVLKNRLKTYE